MTERSWPWPGVTVGDAGPYTADEWDDMFERRFGSGVAPYNDRGVIRNWANELEVTDGGANQADVDTGAALVHGKHYDSDAVENIVVPNSVGAWREDLICLQQNWVTQTTRITRINNPADGVGYPAPTQNDGVLWEIPLAAVRINNVGAITLITDLREWVSTLLRPKEFQVHPQPGTTLTAVWLESGPAVPAGRHILVSLPNNGDYALFEFVVPMDFISLRSAIVYYWPTGTGTWDYTVGSVFGGCGEQYDTHTDSITAAGVAVTDTQVECLDIINALDGLAPGDIVGVRFRRGAVGGATTDIRVAKLIIEYA